MIISVPEIVFFTSAMIIAGRKKIMFRPNTINLLPEKMIVMTDPIVSVREKSLAGMSGIRAFAEGFTKRKQRQNCLSEAPGSVFIWSGVYDGCFIIIHRI